MNDEIILRLPGEPPAGAIVEILDGTNKGNRYKRDYDSAGWRRLGYTASGDDPYTWSQIWWAVTEDGEGGSQVKVTISDPNDPYPIPWQVCGSRIVDAHNDVIPLEFIALRANNQASAP